MFWILPQYFVLTFLVTNFLFVMSWVEFCEIRKIWQQLIYLEVSTLVQGCGQALIYRLHHQYQDHHFVFHMMICWAFPNKTKFYAQKIYSVMVKTGSSLSLAQIQFNFIPGQRAKLQLVDQGIQCSGFYFFILFLFFYFIFLLLSFFSFFFFFYLFRI